MGHRGRTARLSNQGWVERLSRLRHLSGPENLFVGGEAARRACIPGEALDCALACVAAQPRGKRLVADQLVEGGVQAVDVAWLYENASDCILDYLRQTTNTTADDRGAARHRL